MITEDQLELLNLDWFREGGFEYAYRPDIAQDGDDVIKKIAGYHQFHAVREAVRATLIAAQSPQGRLAQERVDYGKRVVPGSRKAGVVWHTQGSGKSAA